ncbi:hypothetical protein [Maritimibacter sp. UBA3975]|uniref:hypothetical protein n=1 Tax=Maritimibacter sp. UBA3975 TaxID=1946833 RepID=UPI000C091474|nr:hypothetical protein [Maritimibacter sp. UBA3975]MAM63921.1 hypothetical protein [Maritimibacter sp.]|tara:strand:+ start:19489 stop:19857 length:369 start_codon:yes stop_codon:yes gene_type:complete
MRAILLLPIAFTLGGCALFGGRDAPSVDIYETSGSNEIAVASTKDGMMIVGGATRFDGTDYETYTEHMVDTDSGDVTGTRHYVMVEGEVLDCPQSDCSGTVARYYGVPGVPVESDGETYIIR